MFRKIDIDGVMLAVEEFEVTKESRFVATITKESITPGRLCHYKGEKVESECRCVC